MEEGKGSMECVCYEPDSRGNGKIGKVIRERAESGYTQRRFGVIQRAEWPTVNTGMARWHRSSFASAQRTIYKEAWYKGALSAAIKVVIRRYAGTHMKLLAEISCLDGHQPSVEPGRL